MKNFEFMRETRILEILIVFAIVSIVLGWTLPDPAQNLSRSKVDHGLNVTASDREALASTELYAEFFYLPAGTKKESASPILFGANCDNRRTHLSAGQPGFSPACRN